MDLGFTIGTIVVSLSIFILFVFGAVCTEKPVAKAQTAREILQVRTALKPAKKKYRIN